MKNSQFVVIILVLLLGFLLYLSHRSKESPYAPTPVVNSKVEESSPSYDVIDPQYSSYDVIDIPPSEPAFEIGFGMGPGLYGSGRHTSEMVGN